MGTRRRNASSRHLLRLITSEDDRETLLSCPACKGKAYRVLENNGRYRMVSCTWCEHGMVDRLTMAMFIRWESMYNYNQKMGRCK